MAFPIASPHTHTVCRRHRRGHNKHKHGCTADGTASRGVLRGAFEVAPLRAGVATVGLRFLFYVFFIFVPAFASLVLRFLRAFLSLQREPTQTPSFPERMRRNFDVRVEFWHGSAPRVRQTVAEHLLLGRGAGVVPLRCLLLSNKIMGLHGQMKLKSRFGAESSQERQKEKSISAK